MKFSENWLRSHVPTNATRDELAATLTAIGLEVEEMTVLGAVLDGVVVARVEADNRDEVRDLAVALRDRPGIRAVVLGASPGGKGVALVAAVAADSGLDAAALIADAARTVGGGGGKGSDLAAAGGKLPEHLDEALEQVRAAAGLTGQTFYTQWVGFDLGVPAGEFAFSNAQAHTLP